MNEAKGISVDSHRWEMYDAAAANFKSCNHPSKVTGTASLAHIMDLDSFFRQPNTASAIERVVSPIGWKNCFSPSAQADQTTTVPPQSLPRPYEDHFLDPVSPRGRRMFDYRPDLSGFAAEMTRHMPFPFLLYWILEEATEKGYDHIISWMPHGRGFVIIDRKEMARVVMPK